MKRYFNVRIPHRCPAAVFSSVFMALSVICRGIYYFHKNPSAGEFFVYFILPAASSLLLILANCIGGKLAPHLSCAAVTSGVVFFIIKAFTFTPLHRNLCILLYITVLALYSLTVFGLIPTKKMLYPLFSLPLFYHIFVEDMQLYVLAEPTPPFFEWLPEISVLLIMLSLLIQSFAMKTDGICN